MVVQGEVIAQTSTNNLTLSGTLLNEGTVSAYYATAVGYLQGSSPNNTFSAYIGEVDVNTPVPFTVNVPYSAGASSNTINVSLVISYQDSFGRNLTAVASTPTTLLSAAQLAQQSSSTATTNRTGVRAGSGIFLLTIIIVIVVVVVAVVVVRRRNSGKKGKKSNVI